MRLLRANFVLRKRSRIWLRFVLAGLLAAWHLLGMQTLAAQENSKTGAAHAAEKLPEFDVATIKPVDPKTTHMVGINVYPGGRVVINGVPLKTLICIAFNVSYWQLSGGDDWTDKLSYNVEAKPAESV